MLHNLWYPKDKVDTDSVLALHSHSVCQWTFKHKLLDQSKKSFDRDAISVHNRTQSCIKGTVLFLRFWSLLCVYHTILEHLDVQNTNRTIAGYQFFERKSSSLSMVANHYRHLIRRLLDILLV